MRKKAVGLVPLVFALGCEHATPVTDKSEKVRPTQAPQIPSDQRGISWDGNGRLVINDPELAAQVRAFCNIAPDEVGTVRAQIRLGGGAAKAGESDDTIEDSDMVVDVRC